MSRLISGIQPVRQAIQSEKTTVERVLVASRLHASSPTLQALGRLAASNGVDMELVDASKLDSMSRGAIHQGVVAIASDLSLVSLGRLLDAEPSLLTVLDRISDPQNFGAIIRSSVAFGADGVIWPEHDNAPLTAATFRASAGAVEHATLCRVRSLNAALGELRSSGILVVGLAGDSEHVLHDIDLSVPIALVVGSEGSGIRKGVRHQCDHIVSLPTRRPIDALNASAAAAIALYEARRQRDRV